MAVGGGVERVYYVAAEEVEWDYLPLGEDACKWVHVYWRGVRGCVAVGLAAFARQVWFGKETSCRTCTAPSGNMGFGLGGVGFGGVWVWRGSLVQDPFPQRPHVPPAALSI